MLAPMELASSSYARVEQAKWLIKQIYYLKIHMKMLLIQFLSPQFNPSLLIMQLSLAKYFVVGPFVILQVC